MNEHRPMLDNPIVKAQWLTEPLVEFCGGRTHENPKIGIPLYGPKSFGTPRHKDQLHIGFIGEGEPVRQAQEYLSECCKGIDGESYHLAFPGCSRDVGYRFEPVFSERAIEKITQSEKSDLLSIRGKKEQFYKALELLISKLAQLCERDHPLDYVMVVLNEEFFNTLRVAEYTDDRGRVHRDLRRAFKASAMKYKKPTQLFRESTIGLGRRALDKPSTRAWNLFTGMYFKGGGLPWGPHQMKPSTCYVGVSFFKPIGEPAQMRASVARAFDENGEGLVLRGQKFLWDEDSFGRAPHLSAEHAHNLIRDVLNLYERERKQKPQRVVVHKTSKYDTSERDGFREALRSVSEYDLVAIMPRSDVRLLRTGAYPPLRGTVLDIGDQHYLYSTGYMPFMSAYPHGHVPSPLCIVDHVGDSPANDLLRDILALTKMNWNSANCDGVMPITLTFSRLVGDIMREVPHDSEPESKFIYYM